jgi:hypothetical protein
MKAKDRCCRTCMYWAKPPGQRAVSGRVFECTAPIPDAKWPESITAHWRVKEWTQNRKYMGRDEGKNCPCWDTTF